MTLKICLAPRFTRPDRGDGGIRRVTDALARHLPEFGVEVVERPEAADLLNCHGTSLINYPGLPMVATCHGLMWADYTWDGHWVDEVNRQVVEVLARGVAHTAPSQWVANAMRRGMLVYPEVIYHGVDTDEWQPGESQGYVLWNKARADAVSDPRHMEETARRLPSVPFVSTLGRASANVRLTGVQPYEAMRDVVRSAGVYLATARETFGIGTLEALSAGVPVAGWAYGGQAEIVVPGETGYLAPYGDYEALAECIQKCLAERPRLSANARQDALQRWTWPARVRQYADLFQRVYREHGAERPTASVVVTAHNLGRYLGECLDSVLAQSLPDWECVIVDDWSDDDTAEIARHYCGRDERFAYHRTPENLKLSGARNFGAELARGRYLAFLDADDQLAPEALGILARHLDKSPAVHIAYGHLDIVDVQGGNRGRGEGWPFASFSWRGQMAHLNQMPYAAMFRREAFLAGGGYRRRAWRAEDAEMTCRLTSFGFRAEKATEAATLIYRNRADSKSKGEPGDGDWTAWFPWRLAGSAREASQKRALLSDPNTYPNAEIVPWGAQGKAPEKMNFWRVPHRAEPLVSVIIPVGPGHAGFVIDALDSLTAQDFGEWEAIVVNDTGQPWAAGLASPVAGAPWARVLTPKNGPTGAGRARNLGAAHARGECLLFLDADDYLLPGALSRMVAAYQERGGVVYGDWLRNDSDGTPLRVYEAADFVCGDVLRQMAHSVTVLVPREAHNAVGGFDEGMPGWEDWNYFIAVQAEGWCSTRVPQPTFVYRFRAGTRRESSFGNKEKLLAFIRDRWSDYYERKKTMGCARCPGGKYSPPAKAKSNGNGGPPVPAELAQAADVVLLVYQGDLAGPVSFRGPQSRKTYRFGRDGHHERGYVIKADAAHFLAMSKSGVKQFELAEAPRQQKDAPPPPLPENVAEERAQPEFPQMPEAAFVNDPADSGAPDPAYGNVGNLTYKQLRDVLPNLKAHTMQEYLEQEESAEAPRVSVVKLLKRALELQTA